MVKIKYILVTNRRIFHEIPFPSIFINKETIVTKFKIIKLDYVIFIINLFLKESKLL
jgi:hypothetical protein